MKKKISLLTTALLLAIFSSCSDNIPTFTINGELSVKEFEGCPVYLTTIDNGDTIDSTSIQNGKFIFRATTPKPMMGRVLTAALPSGMRYYSTLVLETGKIYINLENDSLSGSPLNDLFYKTFTADPTSKELSAQMKSALDNYYAAETPEAREAAIKVYSEADSTFNSHLINVSRETFHANSGNILGAYALSQIVAHDGITYEKLDSIMNHSDPIVADYEPLRKARTQLFHLANTAEGKHYVDIDGKSFPEGEDIKLSSLIDTNQITLVDFWASWCGPCRQEISENLIRLYATYKDKGVNVIGVDVWDKTPDHKAAVEKLGITYPQIIDTTGDATDQYGIKGIPVIMLLGQDGTILRRDIRGEQIEEAIVAVLDSINQTKK